MTHTQAGLAVGDMILCVNKDELLGADYDTVRYFLVFSLSFSFYFLSFILKLPIVVVVVVFRTNLYTLFDPWDCIGCCRRLPC